jgi:hypothetical protein
MKIAKQADNIRNCAVKGDISLESEEDGAEIGVGLASAATIEADELIEVGN